VYAVVRLVDELRYRACVAIAAKHPRIIWAMLAKGEPLQLA
jgi:hypothetical protein